MTMSGYVSLMVLITCGEGLRLNQDKLQDTSTYQLAKYMNTDARGTVVDPCGGEIEMTLIFAAKPEMQKCIEGKADNFGPQKVWFDCITNGGPEKKMALKLGVMESECAKSTTPTDMVQIGDTKLTAEECYKYGTSDYYVKSKAFGLSCAAADVNIPTTTAKGDPHVTTLDGQKLDLVKSGSSNLLNIPRGEQGSKVSLRVGVVVDPVQLAGCTYQFIKEVNIHGQWVNIDSKPVHLRFSAGELQKPEPFSVFVDGNKIPHSDFLLLKEIRMLDLVTASAKQNKFSVKVHGSTIDVELVKNPLKAEFRGVQFLNVNVQGLRNMGVPVEYVGGVLGLDREGTGTPAHCQKVSYLRTISTAE